MLQETLRMQLQKMRELKKNGWYDEGVTEKRIVDANICSETSPLKRVKET